MTTGATSRLPGAGVLPFGLVRVTGSDICVLARLAMDAVVLKPQDAVGHPSQQLVFRRQA